MLAKSHTMLTKFCFITCRKMLTICRTVLYSCRFQNGKSIYHKYLCQLSAKLDNDKTNKSFKVTSKDNFLQGKDAQLHSIYRHFKSTEKDLGLIKDMGSLHKSPAPPLLLGVSGLIPFVTPPLIMYTQGVTCPELLDLQLYYGAVILSFLGGVRWGMAATPGSPIPGNWAHYSWSVVPSLIAWGSLIAPGTSPGLATVIFGIGITCYKDLSQTGYPSWFKGLRMLLTFVAILSMSSSLVITYMFETKKPLSEAILTSKTQLQEQINALRMIVEENKTASTEIKEEANAENTTDKLDKSANTEVEESAVNNKAGKATE